MAPSPAHRPSAFGARNACGSAAVEYVVLVGVVALLALHAFSVFGTEAASTVRSEGADVSKLGF